MGLELHRFRKQVLFLQVLRVVLYLHRIAACQRTGAGVQKEVRVPMAAESWTVGGTVHRSVSVTYLRHAVLFLPDDKGNRAGWEEQNDNRRQGSEEER